jgi:hypothetical protein
VTDRPGEAGHAESERRRSPGRRFEDGDTLFDLMPQLAWVANADGWITRYNRRWYEYTGATPEQMLGWGWESVHDPEHLPTVLAQWSAAIDHGIPFQMSFPLRRADGVFRWFLTNATPIRGSSGKIIRWIGIHTDIDDQKRAETRLGDAVRAREELLAVVSHDLRNPLSTVMTGATLIERLADDSELGTRTKKTARTLIKAAQHMSRLVCDLLDLAQLEVGKPLSMERERTDLVEVARVAVELALGTAEGRRLELRTALPERALHVRGDADRLEQTLSNLLSNAMKFTPAGGSIGVRVARVEKEIQVSVTDTGVGIREDQAPLIFNKYWQAVHRKGGGAGLGLAIATAIVEAHGGRIWMESVIEKGSTFYIALPALDD